MKENMIKKWDSCRINVWSNKIFWVNPDSNLLVWEISLTMDDIYDRTAWVLDNYKDCGIQTKDWVYDEERIDLINKEQRDFQKQGKDNIYFKNVKIIKRDVDNNVGRP